MIPVEKPDTTAKMKGLFPDCLLKQSFGTCLFLATNSVCHIMSDPTLFDRAVGVTTVGEHKHLGRCESDPSLATDLGYGP